MLPSIRLEVVALFPNLEQGWIVSKGFLYLFHWNDPLPFLFICSFIIFPVFNLYLNSLGPLVIFWVAYAFSKFFRSMPLSGNMQKPVMKNNSVIYL